MKISIPKPPELDEEQREAVFAPDNVFVDAGGGAGKTRTIHGLAYYNRNVSHLITTLTNEAEAEILKRAPWANVKNIHSFCFQELQKAYNHHYELKTFDDLITDFLDLKNKPKFDLVGVDEGQTIDPLEWEVINSIVGKRVFIVGDRCQAVFDDFTYAKGAQLREYAETVFGCKTYPLKLNYRSNQNIIKKLESIFQRGMIKSPQTKQPNGLTSILVRTNYDVKDISQILKEENIPHNCILPVARRRNFNPSRNNSKLYVMDIHCSIGLEFENNFIKLWEKIWHEPTVHYVAVARTMQNLKYFHNLYEIIEEVKNESRS